jgi:hypothetical protein
MKPKMSLLPQRALWLIGELMTQYEVSLPGESKPKHAHAEWKQQSSLEHIDAALRHLVKYNAGNYIDDESECSHLLHAATRLLMAVHLADEEEEKLAAYFGYYKGNEESDTYSLRQTAGGDNDAPHRKKKVESELECPYIQSQGNAPPMGIVNSKRGTSTCYPLGSCSPEDLGAKTEGIQVIKGQDTYVPINRTIPLPLLEPSWDDWEES